MNLKYIHVLVFYKGNGLFDWIYIGTHCECRIRETKGTIIIHSTDVSKLKWFGNPPNFNKNIDNAYKNL